jgi:hypothetical protein
MSIYVPRRLQGNWDNRRLILARSNRSGLNEGPLHLQAHGVCHIHAGHDSLDNDVMFPTVGEVVLVPEDHPLIAEKFVQATSPRFSMLSRYAGRRSTWIESSDMR